MARDDNYKRNTRGGKGKNKKRDVLERKGEDSRNSAGASSVLVDAGKRNDFSWYNKYPDLLNDATRISFFNQLGAEIDVTENYYNRVPGICVFDLINTPGTSTTVDSAISRAAVQLYESMRKNLNKPNTEYESQDVAIMLACIADLHAQAANIARVFGILGRWQSDNLYTPRAILRELYNFSFTEYNNIISHGVANYREQFNEYINYANWLEVPADFAIINRWCWPYEGLYKDSKTTKGQIYAFKKANYYVWDEEGTTGSAAKSYPLDADGSGSLASLLYTFRDCISRLYNSTSVRVMQSDLRRAFQNVSSMTFLPIPPDYALKDPEKLDVVLSQIENLNIVRPVDSQILTDFIKSFEIKQDPMDQVVYCDPKWEVPNLSSELENARFLSHRPYFLNLHWDNPNSEDITEATRLMTVPIEYEKVDEESEEHKYIAVLASSAQVCIGMHICINPDATENYHVVYDSQNLMSQSAVALGAITQFDWAPFAYLWDESQGVRSASFMGDLDNYTLVDESTLNRLHDVCLLSLWKAPDVATLK